MDTDDLPQTFPVIAGYDDPASTVSDEQTVNEEQSLLHEESDWSDRIIRPTRCKGCTVIVEPLLFLFMLSQFPLLIILPQYIMRREWERLMGNASYPASTNACSLQPNITHDIRGNLTTVAAAASIFGLKSTLCAVIPAIVSVMFLGPFSDRVGRKYAIIIPIIGQLFTTLNITANVYFHLPLDLLLVGAFVYGLCGYWTTLFMGVISYITDITPKSNRSFRLVMAELCSFAPTILSAAGSGFWVNQLGFSLVFFIIFLFNIVILLYAIFLVPETIRRDPEAQLLSLQYVKKAVTVFAVDGGTGRRWKLLTLLFAIFAYVSAASGVDAFFEMGHPLCWGTVIMGIFSAISISISVVGSGVSAKVMGLFLRDEWMTVVAVSLGVAGSVFKFFVTTSRMMLASTAFGIMGHVFIPTVRAILSKLVKQNEVGAVFGGVAIVEVVCGLVGAAMLNPVYATTAKDGHPSAVYLLVAGIYLIAMVIMLIYAVLTRKDAVTSDPIIPDKEDKP